MKEDMICKEGIIRAVHDDSVDVEIVISSACSGCHAKSFCIPSDQKQETVTAQSLYGETFEIGEKVQLVLKNASGNKAVVLAYLLPLIVLIIALIASYLITHNELASVVVSIALTILYYFILKKRNHKLEQDFTFYAKKVIE